MTSLQKLLINNCPGLLLALFLVPTLALAAASPGVEVRNGYVRGLPPGTVNTSAYMTLVNNTEETLVLTGATTPAANNVMIHTTVRRQGGMMSMEHVMSAEIPAHGQLKLATGGMHLMLMGMKRQLRDGNTVKMTLQFEGGESVAIELPVISVLNE